MEKVRRGEALTLEERVDRLEALVERIARHTPNLPINRDEPGAYDDMLRRAELERGED